MVQQTTREVAEQFTSARQANDRYVIYGLLAEDVTWIVPVGAVMDDFFGREAVAGALTGGVAGIFLDPSTKVWTLQQILVEGPIAVVRMRLRADTRDGQVYENDYCWIYTCSDGKIVKIEEYVDTLLVDRILRGMGLAATPLAGDADAVNGRSSAAQPGRLIDRAR